MPQDAGVRNLNSSVLRYIIVHWVVSAVSPFPISCRCWTSDAKGAKWLRARFSIFFTLFVLGGWDVYNTAIGQAAGDIGTNNCESAIFPAEFGIYSYHSISVSSEPSFSCPQLGQLVCGDCWSRNIILIEMCCPGLTTVLQASERLRLLFRLVSSRVNWPFSILRRPMSLKRTFSTAKKACSKMVRAVKIIFTHEITSAYLSRINEFKMKRSASATGIE